MKEKKKKKKKIWTGTRNGLSILEQRQTFKNLK